MSLGPKIYRTERHQYRNARILHLWNEGFSSGAIKKMLGLISRMVVAGVVDRAKRKGVVVRSTKCLPPSTGRPPQHMCTNSCVCWRDRPHFDDLHDVATLPDKYRLLRIRSPRRNPIPRYEDCEMDCNKITIFDLDQRSCRWPLWSSDEDAKTYCGRKLIKTSDTYCKEHAARAYRGGVAWD